MKGSMNLNIDDQMAVITTKIDNEICDRWSISKKDVIKSMNSTKILEELKITLKTLAEAPVNIYIGGRGNKRTIEQARCQLCYEILDIIKEMEAMYGQRRID